MRLSGIILSLCVALASLCPASAAVTPCEASGDGWLPGTRLMPAFTADPRRAAFSGGFRYHDDAFNRYRYRNGINSGVLGKEKMFGAVSIGSRLPIYRWDLPAGALQFNVEGGIWALFSFKERRGWLRDGSTLLNTDYSFAFPTTYRIGTVAAQFRFWHLSSHLGDEFLVAFPETPRRNVSNECLDLFVSWEPLPQARLYGGGGAVVHSFKGARVDPFYVEYGAEFRPFGAVTVAPNLSFQPFIAGHARNWQNNRWALGGHYALGVEFAARRGDYRPTIQVMLSYYHGPSLEGQFYHSRTDYCALTLVFELI